MRISLSVIIGDIALAASATVQAQDHDHNMMHSQMHMAAMDSDTQQCAACHSTYKVQ